MGRAALAALLAHAPVLAQSTGNSAAGQAATPAPAPSPATNSVGPPQLRDFNLNGTVTRPVPTTADPTPAPVPETVARPPSPRPSAAAPTRDPVSAPATGRPETSDSPARSPAPAASDSDPSPGAVTVELPPAGIAPIVAPSEPATASPGDVAAPLAATDAVTNWWPWLAALLALALGAAFFLRQRRQPGARYAADEGDVGALVETPAQPAPAARAPAPRPASPARPFADPAPRRPAPVAARVPQPVATTAPPPPPPIPGGIVASGLKPRIEFELVPLRAESDTEQGGALTFDLIIMNRGSAPARDVLIEAQLINAGPRVDDEVGRFFQRDAGTGDRIPVIPPLGRVSIKTRLAAPAHQLAPLVMEGRSLFVPIVAINALYRWPGGELKDSSSFLVGRGDAEGGKLAPFRLDQGARSWTGLAARVHSTGLQQ